MAQDIFRPLASETSILKTVESLTQRNINALVVDSTVEALRLLVSLEIQGDHKTIWLSKQSTRYGTQPILFNQNG